jgi:hypothetical protein
MINTALLCIISFFNLYKAADRNIPLIKQVADEKISACKNCNGKKHIAENKDIITGKIISKLVICLSENLLSMIIVIIANIINKIMLIAKPTSHPKYLIKMIVLAIEVNKRAENNIIPRKKAIIC